MRADTGRVGLWINLVTNLWTKFSYTTEVCILATRVCILATELLSDPSQIKGL
jgi:hypothetical protein